MTVGELKKILEGLPDNMVVCSYDVGGYPSWEFVGAEVETDEDPPDRYPTPPRPFLMITG